MDGHTLAILNTIGFKEHIMGGDTLAILNTIGFREHIMDGDTLANLNRTQYGSRNILLVATL